MACLDVELNTLDFTLSVGPDSLSKIENLLQEWLHKRTTTKSSLQSLISKFVFVSKCVHQSWVFIALILCLLRTKKFSQDHIILNSESCKDIQWWRRFLHDYNGVSMINTANYSHPQAGCLQLTLALLLVAAFVNIIIFMRSFQSSF